MNLMLINLGLKPIPPIPVYINTNPKFSDKVLKVREQQLQTKHKMVEDRQSAVLKLIKELRIASTKEIGRRLEWSKSKTRIAMRILEKQKLVKLTGASNSSIWELV